MSNRGAYGAKKAQTSPQSFGKRLQCIRLAWGWSQGRLAEAIGSNQRLVSHWERDKAKPSGAALASISALLGTSEEALLIGEGFTIPDMPALVEGAGKETAAQFMALSRLLPDAPAGTVMMVNLDAFQAQPLTQTNAIKALKTATTDECEVWIVVRSRKKGKKA